MAKYKLTVVIGRFQPLHNEHVALIEHAIRLGQRTKVFIGSKDEPITVKNPWTYDERVEMLRSVFGDAIEIGGLYDHTYDNNQWFFDARLAINRTLDYGVDLKQICLVGCDKDESTFYLKHFPQYSVDLFEPRSMIHATDIRHDLLAERGLSEQMPRSVHNQIISWCEFDEHYGELQGKYESYIQYKKDWGEGPFLAADAFLIADYDYESYMALITRPDGTLALPGGFLNKKERFEAGARRECEEEITYKVDVNLQPLGTFVADKVDRDPRAQIVSVVHRWDLGQFKELPKLEAADDAADVQWYPTVNYADLRSKCYADHFHLIERMMYV